MTPAPPLRRAARLRAWGAALLLAVGALGHAVAQGQAAIEPRNIALSGDGQWLMVADAPGHTLVLFDARLQRVKSFDGTTLDGKTRSRIAEVHDAPRRKSFIVALQDIAELWEISYDPQAAPIYDGLVHDYRMGEGIARSGSFNIRRTPLDEPLTQLAFDASQRQVLGVLRSVGRGAATGPGRAQIINLDIRRKIAELPADSIPAHDAGSRFSWQGGVLRFSRPGEPDPPDTPR